MRNWFAVIGFVVVALVVGVCTACSDDEDEESMRLIGVESSERPGGRDGDDRDCDGSCGNSHEDCRNNSGNCSDDDGVIVCVVPDACRFG